jgi:hypothetical protein
MHCPTDYFEAATYAYCDRNTKRPDIFLYKKLLTWGSESNEDYRRFSGFDAFEDLLKKVRVLNKAMRRAANTCNVEARISFHQNRG